MGADFRSHEELLKLVLRGLGAGQIAARLGCSEQQVHDALTEALQRFRLYSTADDGVGDR